jgi:hypothetical protein
MTYGFPWFYPGFFFGAPIGVLAGAYDRAIGPGFATFPPFGAI